MRAALATAVGLKAALVFAELDKLDHLVHDHRRSPAQPQVVAGIDAAQIGTERFQIILHLRAQHAGNPADDRIQLFVVLLQSLNFGYL